MHHICEKVLTESHPDITCIAGSKKHIGNPNSKANRCIGIYLPSSPVPVLNHTASIKMSLQRHSLASNNPVQTSVITK